MRIDQCHQRQESVVRNSEDADFAVALWNIFHEPFDGVVRVGRVIDRSGIERTAQRARHYIVDLGAVLAAYVLDDADVTTFEDDFERVVIAMKFASEMSAVRVRGEIVSVVGRGGWESGRVLRAFRRDDSGVQLHGGG